MSALKHRVERGFGKLAALLFDHRWWTLLLAAVLLAALFSQLPKIRFDTSTESFFRADDPAMIDYEAFRDQFGRDELVVIAVDPPDVFDTAFLEKLRDFHDALEREVPYVEEVTSLINARDTRGQGDELLVEDLLETIPQDTAGLEALKERVLQSELYPNLLISEDGRFTTVVVETLAYSPGAESADPSGGFGPAIGSAGGADSFAAINSEDSMAVTAGNAARTPLTDRENGEVVHAVERVMAEFQGPDFTLYLAGSPVVTEVLKRSMQSDMARFMVIAVTAIGLFLLLLFRRISGVFLPLTVVLLSVVSTVALMAATGTPLKLPQMILPSFLLAVGVGASVHLLSIFFREYQQSGEKRAAMVHAMEHSGLPILMTSLTTAAGLASFGTANMAAIADLGVFAAMGVVLSLLFTLLLVPSLIAVFPMRQHPFLASDGDDSRLDRAIDSVLAYAGRFGVRHAWPVVLGSAMVLAIAGWGLSQLRFSHNTLVWFPESMPVRQATDLIDDKLKGTVSIEIVVDTGEENGLYEPAILNGLEELADFALAYPDETGQPFVGKTVSLADMVQEINRALNENDPAAYVVPQDRELIAQELLLFENTGSDDLEGTVDSLFSKTRMTVKVPWRDAATYVDFVDTLQAKSREIFPPDVKVTATGLLKLFTQSVHLLMWSMVESYSIAIAVITVLMVLLIGHLRLGLLSMVPNLTPIVMTLGFMGWVGIRLDTFTILIGSIALGLAVDDTIHFFHNYQRARERGAGVEAAVNETLLGTGRAMLFSTLVLVTGFWLFMFASLNNLFNFGLLTGLSLLLALGADLVFAPALMALVDGRKKPA